MQTRRSNPHPTRSNAAMPAGTAVPLSQAVHAALAVLVVGLVAGCTTGIPAPVVDRTTRPVSPPPPVSAPALVAPPISAAVPGNTAGSQFHVVQRGETLYGIARQNNVDVNALTNWNSLAPGQPLREGQVLRLSPPLGGAPAVTAPGTTIAVVPGNPAIQGQPLPAGAALPPSAAPGLTPIPAAPTVTPVEAPLKRDPKAQRLPYSDAALAAMQRGEPVSGVPVGAMPAMGPAATASSPTPPTTPANSPAPGVAAPATAPPGPTATPVVDTEIKPGGGVDRDGITWTWPTSGKVASKFNDKAPMKGIDIAANTGTPVVAAAAGKVIYVGKEPRGYGQMVVVSHAKETVSVYFHTDKVLVKEQQRVLLGQKIAEVADGTGNKMHFEVRRQGRPLDPISLMPR